MARVCVVYMRPRSSVTNTLGTMCRHHVTLLYLYDSKSFWALPPKASTELALDSETVQVPASETLHIPDQAVSRPGVDTEHLAAHALAQGYSSAKTTLQPLLGPAGSWVEPELELCSNADTKDDEREGVVALPDASAVAMQRGAPQQSGLSPDPDHMTQPGACQPSLLRRATAVVHGWSSRQNGALKRLAPASPTVTWLTSLRHCNMQRAIRWRHTVWARQVYIPVRIFRADTLPQCPVLVS